MIIIKVKVVATSGKGESAKMGNRVTVGVLRKGFWNAGNILILDLGDDWNGFPYLLPMKLLVMFLHIFLHVFDTPQLKLVNIYHTGKLLKGNTNTLKWWLLEMA